MPSGNVSQFSTAWSQAVFKDLHMLQLTGLSVEVQVSELTVEKASAQIRVMAMRNFMVMCGFGVWFLDVVQVLFVRSCL